MNLKKSGKFLANDKQENKIVLKWEISNNATLSFCNRVKRCSEFLAQAYASVELNFLQKYPESISKEMYNSLEPMFKDKEKIDWNEIEKQVKNILKQLFDTGFKNSFSPGDIYLSVLAKDQKTEKPLGLILFLIKESFDCGTILPTVLGVDPEFQNRGLGKLLMSSVFKIIPQTKRIILHTRPTNDKAINAYYAWGFVNDLNPTPNEYLIPEYWINLEYKADQVDTLQKVANNFVDLE
jgi:GNAT superfamily N-acetyltransferase